MIQAVERRARGWFAMIESSGRRYLITLVHGTWGRGFFPRSADPSSPRWFEENSPFRRELEAALAKDSVEFQIQEFHWSGRNSVRARDVAARDLAQHIIESSQFKKHLVIAHSHGGNVATRSLAHLIGSDASVEIVTLSTPFIKLYESASIETRFDGHRHLWSLVCITVALLFWIACTMAAGALDSRKIISEFYGWVAGLISIPIGLFVGFVLGALLGSFADSFNSRANRHKLSRSTLLVEASRYPPYSKNLRRFLVVRGIDDEATLALAFGALLSWLSGLLFRAVSRAGPPMVLFGKVLLFSATLMPSWRDTILQFVGSFGLTIQPVIYGYLAVICFMYWLIVLICLGKGTFGVELLRGSVRIEVDSGNAPNLATELTVVTLRPDLSLRTPGRHFIYDNEGCVLAIVSWLVDHRVAVKVKYDPRINGMGPSCPSLEYDR